MFEYNNGEVEFDPILLTIPVFKKIFKRDRSYKKEQSKKEIALVYFLCDFKSDFYNIINEEERLKEIIKVLELPDDFKIDPDLQKCIDFYKKRQETVSMKLLEGAMIAVDKIDKFFRNLDLNEKDENNKPVHNIAQISNTLNKLSDTVKTIKELQDIVKKELIEKTRARGGGEIGYFEDPDEF